MCFNGSSGRINTESGWTDGLADAKVMCSPSAWAKTKNVCDHMQKRRSWRRFLCWRTDGSYWRRTRRRSSCGVWTACEYSVWRGYSRRITTRWCTDLPVSTLGKNSVVLNTNAWVLWVDKRGLSMAWILRAHNYVPDDVPACIYSWLGWVWQKRFGWDQYGLGMAWYSIPQPPCVNQQENRFRRQNLQNFCHMSSSMSLKQHSNTPSLCFRWHTTPVKNISWNSFFLTEMEPPVTPGSLLDHQVECLLLDKKSSLF